MLILERFHFIDEYVFLFKVPQFWLSGLHPFCLPLKPPPADMFAVACPGEHISEQKIGFTELIISGIKLQQLKLNFYMDVDSTFGHV